MTPSTNTTRRRRSDAGMVHLTARDGAALAWIGEQFGVRTDVAALVIANHSPRSAPLSRRTVRVQLDRWERAGLVLRQRLYGRSWVVPTAAGLAFAGLPYTPWRPSYGRLAHVHAVSVVRLALEAAAPGLQWISERALERERRQAGGTWHRPDAAVEVPAPPDRPQLQQALHAIEVELTPKSRPNLAEVFDTLTANTVAVTYFAPAGDVPALRAALAEVTADHRPRIDVRVVELPRVAGVSYEGER
jgi:hypothetical protein